MITYNSCSTDDELLQILSLQIDNLPNVISEEKKTAEGFVTVHHTLDLLKAMNNVCPHIIAKIKDKVVGYALCMDPTFSDTIEVLKPMFKEIENALRDSKSPLAPNCKYIVMGQVCIAIDFRKQGIFRNLYVTIKQQVIPPNDFIINEVDANNKRSLEAHLAIGFQKLKTYHTNGQDWELIYL